MAHEVFVQGFAANTSVKATVKGVIAVCGTLMSVQPKDPEKKLSMRLNKTDAFNETLLFKLPTIQVENT